MADQADNRGLPLRPGHLAKPVGAPSPPGERERVPTSAPRGNEVDIRTMIVGAETGFTGEIRSCNRLVVEGTVEGKLDNCQHIIIEESGVFRGETSTENADVRGSFDGVLVARKRLLIRATGRVCGTISRRSRRRRSILPPIRRRTTRRSSPPIRSAPLPHHRLRRRPRVLRAGDGQGGRALLQNQISHQPPSCAGAS
jgi:cytoskeletal protein CcmA (bactofilin family)